MQRNTMALVFVAVAISSVAAAGIKGISQQADNNQQRVEAIKGPRQQFQPIRIAQPTQQLLPAAPAIIQQQQSTKAGPGQITPVFSSKRPIQQVPVAPLLPPRPPVFAPPAPVIIQQQQQQEPEITQQQQQVQEPSDIDPNAAPAETGPAILAPAAAIAAPASEEEANPKPEPYSFNYAFDAGDAVSSGSSSREESQDASGRVTGKFNNKSASCEFKGDSEQATWVLTQEPVHLMT